MRKPLARDNTVSYFAGLALIIVLSGFAFTWYQQYRTEKFRPQISYANIGPVVLSYQGYSFSTKLAIRTAAGDAEWASNNMGALEIVLQNALAQVDPKQVLAANDIAALQESLKDDINKAFRFSKVHEVLLTDFVFASDE